MNRHLEPEVFESAQVVASQPLGVQPVEVRWAQVGIRQLSSHALRHTYASILIQQGESLAFIKEQLGHSSIQTTVDIYGHLVPGYGRDGIERLANLTRRNHTVQDAAHSTTIDAKNATELAG